MPLAAGFGVETALSIDLGRQGFRIIEVPIEVRHRATGTDLRGQLHRGRQFLHVAPCAGRAAACLTAPATAGRMSTVSGVDQADRETGTARAESSAT